MSTTPSGVLICQMSASHCPVVAAICPCQSLDGGDRLRVCLGASLATKAAYTVESVQGIIRGPSCAVVGQPLTPESHKALVVGMGGSKSEREPVLAMSRLVHFGELDNVVGQ